jgi:uncharacterized membrane protein YeaQ/YmgE (transglycosylase-associated protein family)
MSYIKKISNYAIAGSIGAAVAVGLLGCEQKGDDAAFTQASQTQGAFVVIEEVAKGQYKIVDEYPSPTTRVILKDIHGGEKILSQEELDKLVADEAAKIDAGTSALTNPEVSSNDGGMGLGGTILASMAGAILGSYIGNKLFNNSNYQQQRRTSYKSPSTYSKSVNSFNKAKSTASAKKTSSSKSGFFGSSSKSSSKKSSFGYGG